MKLDDLLTYDDNAFNPDEWYLYLEQGPMKGSLLATLQHGHWEPDGSAHLEFTFRAPTDVTFIGFRCKRAWEQDHDGKLTTFIRTVREETWTPAYQMQAGAMMSFDFIIDPKEWA